jgi:hypothetical protein
MRGKNLSRVPRAVFGHRRDVVGRPLGSRAGSHRRAGCWCLAGLSTVPIKWSVFDAGGRWLGDVTLPPRFTPLEIGADYVLGRSRGTDNVARAVMYRLDKPR